jgi:hypothetical protein
MGTESGPQNLTGVWNGLYTYSSGLSVSFVATLVDGGSALSGTTHEPNVLGSPSGGTLFALLSGGRHGRAISFVKTYDEVGPKLYYPVHYEGALNADATEIEGRWRIGDGTTGKFLMIRSNGKVVALERKQRMKV